VREAMLPCLDALYGNPGSLHGLGAAAARALDEAREQVAQALGGSPRELVFTSGGTEANNLALRGVVAALRRRGDHAVTSAVEHPSVAEVFNALEADGLRVTRVPVDAQGRLDARAVVEAVTPSTILVSVMHVQNETGAVFPVQAIARQAKQKNAVLRVHSDGVQAFGKLPTPEAVDLYSVSAHKLHGPKGAGALLLRKGSRVIAQQRGGGQEHGLRSGTENVPALVGFGVAAALAREARAEWTQSARELGQRLRAGVEALGGVLNSPPDAAPWIVNVSFPGVAAEPLLHALEERGVYVSTGAACASRKREPSPVLRAMGLGRDRLESALRFSLSRLTRPEDVEAGLAGLEAALGARRAAT